MTDSSNAVEQAEKAPQKRRVKLRYYLDTGAVLEFEAAKYAVTQGQLNGDLRGYSFEDAVGEVPFWVDTSRIVAVTREIEDDEDES